MGFKYSEIHRILKLSGSPHYVSGIRQTRDKQAFCLVSFSSREYKDKRCENNVIRYVGHGKGDQVMWRDNRKLNECPDDTPLWVFQRVGDGLKFLGIYKKYGEVYEEQQDGRRVFVFPIKKCTVKVNV